jgi:hypothetical protein
LIIIFNGNADFEGEADPFADVELKTLNDLAELRTILATDRSATDRIAANNRNTVQPPSQLNGPAAPANIVSSR